MKSDDKRKKKETNHMLESEWRNELKKLAREKNMTQEKLCAYLGVEVAHRPTFWSKMPHKREVFIGLGMALKQPLNVINRWLIYYGRKDRLYSKNMSDITWIYLVNACYEDLSTDVNYYIMYDECFNKIETTYKRVWRAGEFNFRVTDDLNNALLSVAYDEEYINIVRFVEENFEAISSAYVKPRRLLAKYVTGIIETLDEYEEVKWNLSRLRGYLDDSMINYLAGEVETINVISKRTKMMTSSIKKIPRSRDYHVRLGISLGMAVTDLNDYLQLMGYAMLNNDLREERELIKILEEWEREHPLQRQYKDEYIYEKSHRQMDLVNKTHAVESMLGLRLYIESRGIKL